MDGFGPILIEKDEPVFHTAWEARTRALSQVTRNCKFSFIDEGRHYIERINPAYYIAASYYQKWLLRMETVLIEKGVITAQELEGKMIELSSNGSPPRDALGPIRNVKPLEPSARRQLTHEPTSGTEHPEGPIEVKYPPGTVVRGKCSSPLGHTRIPRYVRGKKGVVEAVHGLFYLPDVRVHEGRLLYQPVYRVRFEARELWGQDASPQDKLYIELWEDYLELGE